MVANVNNLLAFQSTGVYHTNSARRNSVPNSVMETNSGSNANVAQIKNNVRSDIRNGKLVHQPAIEVLGLTLRKGYYLYHPAQTETWDDLKRRYNIPDGVLKAANGLRFEACSMDERGDYLGSYEINYFKRNGAKIPEKYIKKYLP